MSSFHPPLAHHLRDRRPSHRSLDEFGKALRDRPVTAPVRAPVVVEEDKDEEDKDKQDTDMVFRGLGSCSERRWIVGRLLFLGILNVLVFSLIIALYWHSGFRDRVDRQGDFWKQACHYLPGNFVCYWIYCVASTFATWAVHRRDENLSWNTWPRRVLDLAFSNFWGFGLATLLGIMVTEIAKKGPLDSMKQH